MDEVLPLARPNFSLVADSSKLGPRRRTHATMSHHDTHGSLKRFSSDCHSRLCALFQLWALADSLTLATEHVRRCSILPAADIEPLAPSHRRQLISQRLNVHRGKVTGNCISSRVRWRGSSYHRSARVKRGHRDASHSPTGDEKCLREP